MKMLTNAQIGDPFSPDGEPINDSRTGESGEGTSGASRTSAGPTVEPKEFLCNLCAGRTFTSQRGLSLHMRRTHPVEYEEKLTQAKELNPSVKHVWREEEHMLIAEAELRLRAGPNPPRAINKALAELFPQWSDNVISCQRKRAPYQDAMRKLRKQVEKESEGSSYEERNPGGESSGPTQVTEREIDLTNLSDTHPEANNTGPPTTPARDQNQEQLEVLDTKFEGAFSLYTESLREIYHGTSFINDSHAIEEWLTKLAEKAVGWKYAEYRPKKRVVTRPTPPQNESRTQRKARLRQRTLQFWDRDPHACGKAVMNGTLDTVDTVSQEDQQRYWSGIFGKSSVYTGVSTTEDSNSHWGLADPISRDELDAELDSMAESAAGPEGMTLKQLKASKRHLLVLLLNVVLRTNVVPKWLVAGRVTLIPKSTKPSSPSDFRPITVSPMLLRLFHRILARRLEILKVEEAQVAYQKVDGCQRNVYVLSSLIQDSQKTRQPLYAMFVDVKKAFDSVSREALMVAARRKGVPEPLLLYLRNIFESSGVYIGDVYCEQRSGVRQGDPLSGALFNMVIELVYEHLSKEIGYPLIEKSPSGEKERIRLVSHLLFADDGILFANSVSGLNSQAQRLVKAFATCGMELNPAKCAILAKAPMGRGDKAMICIPPNHCQVRIGGELVPVLGPKDKYKYLGIEIGPYGFVGGGPEENLERKLSNLEKSALKPQNKLYVLKTQLIPSILYPLTVGQVVQGPRLSHLDVRIRAFVRKVLHLLHDVPNAAIHAPVKAGGLGVIPLAHVVPLDVNRRITSMVSKPGAIVTDLIRLDHCRERIAQLQKPYKLNRVELLSKETLGEALASELHTKVDGAGLRHHAKCKQFDQWMCDPKMAIRGREFILAIHARLGCLNTPSRAWRGRGEHVRKKMCWRDRQPATLNHISQYCESTHGLRVERHDAVVKLMFASLAKKGLNVAREPKLAIENRKWLEPDLVLLTRDRKRIHIIDPIICSDHKNLEEANAAKQTKYTSEKLWRSARDRLLPGNAGSEPVEVHGAAFNCRGTVAGTTRTLLAKLFSRRYCAYIVLRILVLTAKIVLAYRRTIEMS